MNQFIGIGRIASDVDVKYTPGGLAIAKYTYAMERKFKKEGEPDADFPHCIAFGRQAEFAEKHLKKGMKIAVIGRIQTGSYTNKDGNKVYTTDIVVENQEFVESKKQNEITEEVVKQEPPADGKFHPVIAMINVPEGIDEHLPFT